MSLAEEATKSKGGHFAKPKWFSIAKITFLWRGLKFKRGHGPPGPPISAAYAICFQNIAFKICDKPTFQNFFPLRNYYVYDIPVYGYSNWHMTVVFSSFAGACISSYILHTVTQSIFML